MLELVEDESQGDPQEGPADEKEWLEIARKLGRMICIVFWISGSTEYPTRNKPIRENGAKPTQYRIDSSEQVSQTLLKRLKMIDSSLRYFSKSVP